MSCTDNTPLTLADGASFSAAMLGRPKVFQEVDIRTEYPADVDDENISDSGFQPNLSGESTRLSSALELFKGARILSKVLDEVYSAALSSGVSLQTLGGLDDELDQWLRSLPAHLRLQFAQDKPSTNVCGSRSPILVSHCCWCYSLYMLMTIVTGISLYSHFDSSTCCLIQPWSQSRSFSSGLGSV